jgi:transcriptional regulator with XRE-family HTH domain
MDADQLKLWLKERDLFPRDLAEAMGVSRSLVALWTQGKRDVPKWLDFALGFKSARKELKKRKK